MNEQTIILIFLVMTLGITLWLYILKAIKQVNYKGDERWKLIQLKANNAANLAHSILIVLIAILPLFICKQQLHSNEFQFLLCSILEYAI